MQQLFQLKNYNVIFEPITMMINEFKAIKDKNKGDDNLTLKEMSYIWFFTDIRSDFQNILDDDIRSQEIKHSISLPLDWEPDRIVLDAIDYYKSNAKTPSSGLYEASMITANFLEKKLRHPETILAELNTKGDPVYKLDNLLSLIQKIPDVMIKLHKAREQVIKEIESESQLKGGKAKAMFEDGI